MSAVRVDLKTVFHQLDRRAVATGDPSWPTRHVLRETGLVVVKYSSADIESVESELAVKSSQSAQAYPRTIEEARRILRVHAGLG